MSEFIQQVLAALRADGIRAHVVGGAVRDLLLGRASKDLDLAVPGPSRPVAEALAARLRAHLVTMDEQRGHYRVVAAGGADWADIGSDNGDLVADLTRRDFTVNAMAVPVERWPDDTRVSPEEARNAVVDPVGGQADLKSKTLRAISEQNLKADPVRLVRAARIANQLRFKMDPATRAMVRANVPLLGQAAPERLQDEFYAIFANSNAEAGVRLLDALGLLSALIPELDEARGVEQPRAHHYWDVFEHLVHATGKAEAVLDKRSRDTDPFLRLVPVRPETDSYFQETVADGQSRATLLKIAAILHDVAKPRCKSLDTAGRIRFFGHQEMGEEMARDILGRLRCSRKAIWHVSTMVRHHLRPSQAAPVDNGGPPSTRAIHRFWRDLEGVAPDTLYLAMADYLAARGPEIDLPGWSQFAGMIGVILSDGFVTPGASKPFLLLDGNEIMAEFGLRPGPRVGQLLEALREAEALGQVQDRGQGLDHLRRIMRAPPSDHG